MNTASTVTLLCLVSLTAPAQPALTPDARFAARLQAVEARRQAVDARASVGFGYGVAASIGYGAAVLLGIWGLAEVAVASSRLGGPVQPPYQPPVAPELLFVAAGGSLLSGIALHVVSSTLSHLADEARADLDSELAAVEKARSLDAARRWRALDGPESAPPTPP
ncbi:MAG: hypothetical protein IPJ65_16640 [Archangiaceae bacterium]|nr:hypothetical protein [Archangiaceae bacterium]